METKSPNLYSDKLAWGLTLLAASLFTELVLAVYGLANLSTEINPETYASGAAGIDPVQILISCLSPLGFLLRIVAIILIVQDSARLNGITNGQHRRLALTGTALFAIGLVIQLVTIFLSFNGTMGGSLQSLQIAMWLGLAASLLGFAAVTALAYFVVPQVARTLLLAGLVLFFIATTGATFLTVQNTSLESYDMMGNTFYVPSMNLDRTQGVYPILSAAGSIAIALTFLTLITAAVNAWRSLTRELPESVA